MFKEDFLTSDVKKEDIYKLVQNEFVKNFSDSDVVELTKKEQESIVKELGFTHGQKALEELTLGTSKGNVIQEMLNRSIKGGKIPVFKDKVSGVEGDFTIGFVGTKSKKSKSAGHDLLLPIIFKRENDSVVPIGIASEAIPNLTKSVYTQNGTLYSQPLVKDFGDGPRNEKIVTTAAFDLKRYVNTFFKNSNDSAKKIIESFNTNVFNDKVGTAIYRYKDRSALESNSPLLQHQHKTLSAPGVITTSDVGSGKNHFGNIAGKLVYLDNDLLNKMIPGIAEAEGQSSFGDIIKTSFRDGEDNNFIFNKEDFKGRVKNYYTENAKKNIDPFYFLFGKSHEQRINKYLELGGDKKQILTALNELSQDRKDYFGSIRSVAKDITSYDKNFLTSDELKGIIEKNKISLKDGVGKKFLDTVEKRLDYIIDKSGRNINSKTELKDTIGKINKQYSETSTLMTLVQGQRKVERVSFEDFEIASKSDRSLVFEETNRYKRNLDVSKILENKISDINKIHNIRTNSRNLYIDGNSLSEKISQNVNWAGGRNVKMFTAYDKELNTQVEKIKVTKEQELMKPILNSDLVVIVDKTVSEKENSLFSDARNSKAFDLAIAEKKDIVVYTDKPRYFKNGKEVNEEINIAKYENVYLKTGYNYDSFNSDIVKKLESELKKDLTENMIGFGRTNSKNRIEINKAALKKENSLYLNIFDSLNDGKNFLNNTNDKSEIKKIIESSMNIDFENKKTIETLKFLQGKNLTYYGNEKVAEVVSEFLNEKVAEKDIQKDIFSMKLILDDSAISKNIELVQSQKDMFTKSAELSLFNEKANSLYGSVKPRHALGGIKNFLDINGINSLDDEHYKSGIKAMEEEWNLKIIEDNNGLFSKLKEQKDFMNLSKKEKAKIANEIAEKIIKSDDKNYYMHEAEKLLGNERIAFADKKYIGMADDIVMLAETLMKKDTSLKTNTNVLIKDITSNLNKGKIEDFDLEKLKIIEKRSPIEYRKIRSEIYDSTGFDIKTKQAKKTNDLVITKSSIETGTVRDIIRKGLEERKPVVLSVEVQKNIGLNKKLNIALNNLGFKSLDFRIDESIVNIQEDWKESLLKKSYDNGTVDIKKSKVITLEALTSTRALEKVYKEFDKIEKNNSIKDEMLSTRVMYNPRLNLSMEYDEAAKGPTTAKFRMGFFMDGAYYEPEFKTKFSNADSAKALIEESKRNTYVDSPGRIEEIRSMQKMKAMLGVMEDRVSIEGKKGYIKGYNKSFSVLEQEVKQLKIEKPEGYRDRLREIEDIRIGRGIRSLLMDNDSSKKINTSLNERGYITNSNNNYFKAFNIMLRRNVSEYEAVDELKGFNLIPKVVGNKIKYDYTATKYAKAIEPLLEIKGLKNKTEAERVELITKQIAESDLDYKTKKSLLYYTPNSDGDINREIYKQTAFLLSSSSGTFSNKLNDVTTFEYMKLLTETKNGKVKKESSMSQLQLSKKVFDGSDYSDFLKRAFKTGEDLSTTSLINKQQNTIAGKFFMTVMDSMAQGNFLNALGQRVFQAADLRGDVVYRENGINKNLNVLVSEVSESIDKDSPIGKNVINSGNAIDSFNIIEKTNRNEIEDIVRYENNKVKHVVLVGDVRDINIDRSIYGYSAAFQEGAIVSKESASAAASMTLQKHSFSIYKNLDYEKFSSKIGVSIKNEDELYQYLKANPDAINHLFSTEVKNSKANQKMLVEGLENIKNMNGSEAEKLYELAKLKVAGEINKKVSVDVTPKNVENVLGHMFNSVQNSSVDIRKELDYIVRNYALLKDFREGKFTTEKELKTQKSKLLYGLQSSFFQGDLKEEKTLILDKSLFKDTFGDSYMYRKVSNGITLESVELTREGLNIITGDISEVTKASKMYSSNQKYTASAMPDYISVKNIKGDEFSVSAIINMKLEKRGQAGSKIIDAINTSLSMVYETDKTKVPAFVNEMKDILDVLRLDIKSIDPQNGIFHSFRHIEKMINETNGDYNLMNDIIRNPEKATEYHFENKRIKDDIIAKYGGEFKDADKADFALVKDIAKRYEDFKAKELGGQGKDMFQRIKKIALGIDGNEIEIDSGDVMVVTYTNMAKSAATESKKSHDGMKLNYIMENMFGIQGYKTLQEEIYRNGSKEGTEVLVKTLTSLHDEYSIGRNVSMDQLAALKYQDKLVKSLAESFTDVFGRTVETYNGTSSHILGKEDFVDGSFKKAVAVIDLAKVKDSEYFIKELGEDGKSISDLANFKTIQNGVNEKQLNIVKDSLEHRIVEDYLKNKDISVLEKYIGEARNESLDLGGIAKKIMDTDTQINVFDSYIGKELVESGIINQTGIAKGKIKGEIILTDSRAYEKYIELKTSSDFIKEIINKRLDVEDDIANDLTKKVDLLFQGKLTQNTDLSFLNGVKKEIEGVKNQMFFQLDENSLKGADIAELTTKTLRTIEFLEENKNNNEVINSFGNFYKNFGIRSDVVSLDFDLESNNLEKIVTSDSVRTIETAIRDYIGIDKSKRYIESLRAKEETHIFAELDDVFSKIANSDKEIITEGFSLKVNRISGTLNVLKEQFKDNEVIPKIAEDFEEMKQNLFDFSVGTNLYMKNKSLLGMNVGDEKELENSFKNLASDLLDIRETAKIQASELKKDIDELIVGDERTALYNLGGAYRTRIAREVEYYTEELTKAQLKNFELNLQETTLSSKKSELFQSMRFNLGENSRVAKPLEGSIVEEMIGNKLIVNGEVSSKTISELKELVGNKIVDMSLINSANDSLDETKVASEYLDTMVRKNNRTILEKYFTDSEIDDYVSGRKKITEDVKQITSTGKMVLTPGKKFISGIEYATADIVMKNRIAELSEIAIYDSTIDKNFNNKVSKNGFARTQIFVSRHPQQTQYHTTGMTAIALNTKQKTNNSLLAEITELMSRDGNNEAGVMLIGKKTFKNKRGDFDGDAIAVAFLNDNDQSTKNIALFQANSMNYAFEDGKQAIEFVGKDNEIIDVASHGNKTFREFLNQNTDSKTFKLITSENNFNLDEKLNKDWISTNRILLGLKEHEYNTILEVNRLNNFYIKGRIEDEFGKHRNAYKEFIYHVSEDKEFASYLDERQSELSSGKITKNEFDKLVSSEYSSRTGEQAKDFEKLLGKTELSKFFDPKENVSTYNKAVNIKNTGIVFEETAKYRVPGLSMYNFDVDKFISDNIYLENVFSGNETKSNLRKSFEKYAEKQFLFSKLADIYYDNANEAAISAKHGLSLDGLKDVKDKIQLFQGDKELSNLAVDIADKFSSNSFTKKEMTTILEAFQESYYDKGFGYEFIDNADKDFTQTFGSNKIQFESWNSSKVGKSEVDELRTELIDLKSRSDKAFDIFQKTFIKDEKQFESFMDGDNFKMDMFNFEKRSANVAFSGVEREVEYSILGKQSKGVNAFDKMLNALGNRKRSTNDLDNLLGVMQHINRTYNSENKISLKGEKVKAFADEFKIKDLKSAEILTDAFSSILVVFGQNEKNADLNMNIFNKGIEQIKNNVNLDESHVEAKQLNNVIKTVSAVMGDVSNTTKFIDIYGIKLKNDFMEIATSESKIQSKVFNEYLAEVAYKLDNEFDKVTSNGFLEFINKKGLNYKDHVNVIEKLDDSTLENINYLAEKTMKEIKSSKNRFETNSSAEISRIINFGTTSTNAGVSDFQGYLTKIMDSIRTGKPIDVSESSVSAAASKTKMVLKEIEYNTTIKFFQNEEIVHFYESNLKFLRTDEGKRFAEAINNKDSIEALESIKVNFSGFGEKNIGTDFFKQISGRTNADEIRNIMEDYKIEVNSLNKLLEQKGDGAIDFIKNRGVETIEVLKQYGVYEDGKVSMKKLKNLKTMELNKLIETIDSAIESKVATGINLDIVSKVLNVEDLFNDSIGVFDKKLSDNERLLKIVSSYENFDNMVSNTFLGQFVRDKMDSALPSEDKIKWNVLGKLIEFNQGRKRNQILDSINIPGITNEEKLNKVSNLVKNTEKIMEDIFSSKYLEKEISELKLLGAGDDFFDSLGKSARVTKVAYLAIGQQMLDEFTDKSTKRKIKDFAKRSGESFFQKYDSYINLEDYKMNKKLFVKNLEADFAIRLSDKIEKLASQDFKVDDVLNEMRKEYKTKMKDFGKTIIGDDDKTIKELEMIMNKADFKRGVKKGSIAFAAIAATMFGLKQVRKVFSVTETTVDEDKKKQFEYESTKMDSQKAEYSDINMRFK